MKKDETVNIDAVLSDEALRVLRSVPELSVNARRRRPAHGIDALVHYAGTKSPVAIEFKLRVNAATAWHLVRGAGDHPDVPLLVVAEQTTTEARDILRKHRVSLVDGLGNAHIELPGLVYHLSGRRLPPKSVVAKRPVRLLGKAGITAQMLLLHPDRDWKVRSLADAAGTSVALAHRVLTRLEREGIVSAEGAGPARVRRVTDTTALLDLWAEENRDRTIRTPAYLLTQTHRQLLTQLGKCFDEGEIKYAITGSAAASLVAPFVTAVPVVDVWIESAAAIDDLYSTTHARPATEGHNVVFLQTARDAPLKFRTQHRDLWTVNKFRLYVDLRLDPRRGKEQAEHLRNEVIGF